MIGEFRSCIFVEVLDRPTGALMTNRPCLRHAAAFGLPGVVSLDRLHRQFGKIGSTRSLLPIRFYADCVTS